MAPSSPLLISSLRCIHSSRIIPLHPYLSITHCHRQKYSRRPNRLSNTGISALHRHYYHSRSFIPPVTRQDRVLELRQGHCTVLLPPLLPLRFTSSTVSRMTMHSTTTAANTLVGDGKAEAAAAAAAAKSVPSAGPMASSFPVDVPYDAGLTLSGEQFAAYIKALLRRDDGSGAPPADADIGISGGGDEDKGSVDESEFAKWERVTSVCESEAVTDFEMVRSDGGADVVSIGDTATVVSSGGDGEQPQQQEHEQEPVSVKVGEQAFRDGLLSFGHDSERHKEVPSSTAEQLERKMLGANNDIAYRSTKSALVDLFFEAEKLADGSRLEELLVAAWHEDPKMTLKVLFAVRSIHLGKSDRETFYRCFGWLYKHHPLTALRSLEWLVRPVIEKKAEKKDKDKVADSNDAALKEEKQKRDEMEVDVDLEAEEGDEWTVKHGVSHGYWKDLDSILLLHAQDHLAASKDPRQLLNIHTPKETNHITRPTLPKGSVQRERHDNFCRHFENAEHRALHLTIARLFADQLKTDLVNLNSDNPKDRAKISLAGKWAASPKRSCDRHTLIASSIAEILYPSSTFAPDLDRVTYLKHAREQYRRLTLSPLRKALAVVERDLSSNNLSTINYSRVPSIAMSRYQDQFLRKDENRFLKYLAGVATGKSRISGAVLNPALLVHQIRSGINSLNKGRHTRKDKTKRTQISEMAREQVANGQWRTLVQRIRDAGTLSSSIAVVDVSASMMSPVFPDRTTPMDSAIGLGLLISEVAAPPFNGVVITFSSVPSVIQVGDPSRQVTLTEKIRKMENMSWDMNTNFVAVFEDLILPMAIRNQLKQEDMVKRVFVFSDMHFDSAQSKNYARSNPGNADASWHGNFERIQAKYTQAGYEMPELVFWNLAGGKAHTSWNYNSAAPKPVDSDQPGTALVGGYSQALVKIFMEGGSFDEAEVAAAEEEGQEEDGGEDMDTQAGEKRKLDSEEMGAAAKKKKGNPLDVVKRAVSHRAYQMLEVVD